jgi:hypothetical protein
MLREEHVLVLAVGKAVLADDEPEVIPSDVRSGIFDGVGEDGRDTAEKEDFTESTADGGISANHKTAGHADFFAMLAEGESLRAAQSEPSLGALRVNGCQFVVESIHNSLPPWIGEAVAARISQLAWLRKIKPTTVKMSALAATASRGA